MPPAPHRRLTDLSGSTASKLTVHLDLLAARITVIGELDRGSVRHLLDAVRALATSGASRWVVDVQAMAACDPSGLRALSACYRSALRRGAEMTIVGADPSLRSALSRLRLDQHIVQPPDEGGAGQVLDRVYPLARLPGTRLLGAVSA